MKLMQARKRLVLIVLIGIAFSTTAVSPATQAADAVGPSFGRRPVPLTDIQEPCIDGNPVHQFMSISFPAVRAGAQRCRR